jgi:predicted lipid-binding transport protein (Tim44 family)
MPPLPDRQLSYPLVSPQDYAASLSATPQPPGFSLDAEQTAGVVVGSLVGGAMMGAAMFAGGAQSAAANLVQRGRIGLGLSGTAGGDDSAAKVQVRQGLLGAEHGGNHHADPATEEHIVLPSTARASLSGSL